MNRTEPFCDWLDVTCAPESSFIPLLLSFLDCHFFPVAFSEGFKTGFKVGEGVLVIEQRLRFHRASASGSCVDHLRRSGIFRDYVNVLGSVAHKVTRLDVAVDVSVDAPSVLRDLERCYPADLFSFGRKSLRVTRLYSARPSDGQLTGTWYAGHRSSARVTCRVYDKQSEALEKRGESLPPTTRFELTFRKDYGCSLYDVLMPQSLFYSHASPGLLDAPSVPVAPWESRGTVPWESEPVDYSLTISVFDKRVSASPEIARLAELAAQFGPEGKALILRHFERALTVAYQRPVEESA